MVNFFETIIVLGGASIFLGKQDILYISRFIGFSIGRLVGTLQGLRSGYESKYHNTKLYQLQANVRRGIEGLNVIRSDLTSLGRSRSVGLPALPVSQNDTIPKATALKSDNVVEDTFPSSVEDKNYKLSQLILADGFLDKTPVANPTGSDIVFQALSESILLDAYNNHAAKDKK